jgi:hypothetical protein
MRQVIRNSLTYALILSLDDFQPGVKFVCEPEWSLQVGLLEWPRAHTISAHAHLPHNPGQVQHQEFLFVVSGEVEVAFFDENGCRFQTEILAPGQALLQVRGGHGFRFLAETQLIEVKSGPYRGREKDKVAIKADPAASPA